MNAAVDILSPAAKAATGATASANNMNAAFILCGIGITTPPITYKCISPAARSDVGIQASIGIAGELPPPKASTQENEIDSEGLLLGVIALAGRQLIQRGKLVRDEGIARILARRDGRQHEAFRHHHRHILHRMHGEVGLAFLHRHFEFLDEQALAADFGERAGALIIRWGDRQRLPVSRRLCGIRPGPSRLGCAVTGKHVTV